MRASTSGVLVRFIAIPAILIGTMAAMPITVTGQIVRSRVREAASPYTAEYHLTRTNRLADGNLINIESKEVIAVDSQRRRMTETTETVVGGDQGLGTRVFVFDPVARTNSNWTSPGRRATVDTMPELGAARGCSPNATRGDGVNLGVTRTSRPKPVVEDLGTDTVQGVEAHGRRVTTTIPAGEIGNVSPLVRTAETWTAVAPALAGLIVREISDNPQSGHMTRELVSLDQREPDEAAFQPPAGYEIVHMTVSQATCSTEAAATPQQ
jgi:hypothetical protein